ncbi:MAG: aryl-sulfate sulfotransferase [Nocardioidaceae bacterium]
MFRTALALVIAFGILGFSGTRPSSAAAETTPEHSVSVSGAGVGMYPAFDPATGRYAVTTTGDTGGTVTVNAATSDTSGRVWVNGRTATGGATTLTGLEAGDEISVIIKDSAGSAAHSLIYLPAGFPTLSAVTRQPGIAPGLVGLTLTQWNQPTPNFETAVDVNGVPAHVFATMQGTLDLKRQPNGHYSASRTTTTKDRSGSALVELDSTFTEVARHETVGLVNTDGHDSILQPDGSRILIAYEPNAQTGLTDAVIQEVDAAGSVVFEWRSDQLVDESVVVVDPTTNRGKDYAHINSVAVMQDGDILASFRHLSSVLKIARTAHDGFEVGDIVWRLGGRNSDFTFVDDPHPGGPCAQHTASELPNGNILIFDNGSGGFAGDMCINPDDPAGPAVGRTLTRVTEYDLGEVDNDAQTPETATLVWDYEPAGRFGFFAGSAERLANGNTLVGWASVRAAVSTEVDSESNVVWELKDAADEQSPLYSTYRASKFAVPDTIAPEVKVTRPATGATYSFGQRVIVDIGCSDRGGSSLRSCGGTGSSGELLDTSTSGTHTFVAVATDGAGNKTRVTRSYSVGAPPYRPDASIRIPGEPWAGSNVYGGTFHQRIAQRINRRGGTVTLVVRLQNDGKATERLAVSASGGNRKFTVVYLVDGENVTRLLTNGSYRTPRLASGESVRLRIKVTRTRAATLGDTRRFAVRASSARQPTRWDAVATIVRATR